MKHVEFLLNKKSNPKILTFKEENWKELSTLNPLGVRLAFEAISKLYRTQYGWTLEIDPLQKNAVHKKAESLYHQLSNEDRLFLEFIHTNFNSSGLDFNKIFDSYNELITGIYENPAVHFHLNSNTIYTRRNIKNTHCILTFKPAAFDILLKLHPDALAYTLKTIRQIESKSFVNHLQKEKLETSFSKRPVESKNLNSFYLLSHLMIEPATIQKIQEKEYLWQDLLGWYQRFAQLTRPLVMVSQPKPAKPKLLP